MWYANFSGKLESTDVTKTFGMTTFFGVQRIFNKTGSLGLSRGLLSLKVHLIDQSEWRLFFENNANSANKPTANQRSLSRKKCDLGARTAVANQRVSWVGCSCFAWPGRSTPLQRVRWIRARTGRTALNRVRKRVGRMAVLDYSAEASSVHQGGDYGKDRFCFLYSIFSYVTVLLGGLRNDWFRFHFITSRSCLFVIIVNAYL